MLYSLTSDVGFNSGTLVDSAGSIVSNANDIGAQAGLAALFVLMVISSRRRVEIWCLLIVAMVLVVFSVMTASRTSFLALTSALAVSLFLVSGRTAALRAAVVVFMIVRAVAVNTAVQPESHFYDNLMSRLVLDDEGTRGTLGDRLYIWNSAATEFAQNDLWLHGAGTGGVSKVLGASSEDGGRVRGRDGIWRRFAHNTLVWWALSFGLAGCVACMWLGWRMITVAYTLDRKACASQRCTLVAFILIVSVGGIVNELLIWCVLGPALWAGPVGRCICVPCDVSAAATSVTRRSALRWRHGARRRAHMSAQHEYHGDV